MPCEEDIWLLPFLACIRKRPGMYLGHEDVRTLDTFVFAYGLSREHVGLPRANALLDEFTDWMKAITGNVRSPFGWVTLIAEIDPSPRNIPTFFRYFDDFLAQRGLSLTDAHAERWARLLAQLGFRA